MEDSAWALSKACLRHCFGKFHQSPWTNGLLSLLWISLAAFLIVDALKINHAWIIAIFCGILTANITVTSLTATYAPDLGSDMLALLLAVSGWWLFCRFFDRSPLICPPPPYRVSGIRDT